MRDGFAFVFKEIKNNSNKQGQDAVMERRQGDRETEKWDTKTKRNASAENAEKARSMCIIQCGVHDDG